MMKRLFINFIILLWMKSMQYFQLSSKQCKFIDIFVVKHALASKNLKFWLKSKVIRSYLSRNVYFLTLSAKLKSMSMSAVLCHWTKIKIDVETSSLMPSLIKIGWWWLGSRKPTNNPILPATNTRSSKI